MTDQPMTAVEALRRFAQQHVDADAAQALVDQATHELTGRTVVWPETDAVPLRFVMRRYEDVTGISGEGHIADGVRWPDGTASIRWRGPHPKIDFADRGIDTIEVVHGHGGATQVVFLDQPGSAPTAAEPGEVPVKVRRVLEHALRRPVPCPECSRTTACRCIADRTDARIDVVLAALAPWLNTDGSAAA